MSFEPASGKVIQGRFCGANGGWRIVLTFCFFFVKEKEKDKSAALQMPRSRNESYKYKESVAIVLSRLGVIVSFLTKKKERIAIAN